MSRAPGLKIMDFIFDVCSPEPMSGCWLWLLQVDRFGYGKLKYQGRTQYAHRAIFESLHGSQPSRMKIRHKCDNPYCVNPDHLCVGTHLDNMADMVRRKRSRSSKPGSANPRAKLDERTVQIIRREYKRPSDISKFSERFGVSPSTLFNAIHGRTWKHVCS